MPDVARLSERTIAADPWLIKIGIAMIAPD
jgi:hypothetical protein